MAAGVFLYLFLRTPGADFNPKPHQALGRVVAEEAMKLIQGDGRLIVFARDFKSFESPAMKAQWGGFCEAVANGKVKIASTNWLQVDPLRTPSLPAGGYVERAQRAGSNDVIVSFLGLPELTEAQLRRLEAKRVQLVAVCTGNTPLRTNMRRLFERQWLQVAIISRPIPLPQPSENAPWRAWFDGLFQVITAAEAADLPIPAGERL